MERILLVLLVLLDIFLIGANFYVGNRFFSALLSVVLVMAVVAWRKSDG